MSARPRQQAEPAVTAQLLESLRAGDEAAFMQLVEALQPSLLRLAQNFVSSTAVAEEVVQETWAAVLDGLASFAGRASLKTWIFRILVNRARTRGVREGRTTPFSALEPADGHAVPGPESFAPDGHWAQPPRRWDDNTPEVLFLRAEAMAVIEAALAALPASQRSVLTLRDIEGCESDEVCHVLEISESNQRVLLHRARSRLRAALAAYLEGE